MHLRERWCPRKQWIWLKLAFFGAIAFLVLYLVAGSEYVRWNHWDNTYFDTESGKFYKHTVKKLHLDLNGREWVLYERENVRVHETAASRAFREHGVPVDVQNLVPFNNSHTFWAVTNGRSRAGSSDWPGYVANVLEREVAERLEEIEKGTAPPLTADELGRMRERIVTMRTASSSTIPAPWKEATPLETGAAVRLIGDDNWRRWGPELE